MLFLHKKVRSCWFGIICLLLICARELFRNISERVLHCCCYIQVVCIKSDIVNFWTARMVSLIIDYLKGKEKDD